MFKAHEVIMFERIDGRTGKRYFKKIERVTQGVESGGRAFKYDYQYYVAFYENNIKFDAEQSSTGATEFIFPDVYQESVLVYRMPAEETTSEDEQTEERAQDEQASDETSAAQAQAQERANAEDKAVYVIQTRRGLFVVTEEELYRYHLTESMIILFTAHPQDTTPSAPQTKQAFVEKYANNIAPVARPYTWDERYSEDQAKYEVYSVALRALTKDDTLAHLRAFQALHAEQATRAHKIHDANERAAFRAHYDRIVRLTQEVIEELDDVMLSQTTPAFEIRHRRECATKIFHVEAHFTDSARRDTFFNLIYLQDQVQVSHPLLSDHFSVTRFYGHKGDSVRFFINNTESAETEELLKSPLFAQFISDYKIERW